MGSPQRLPSLHLGGWQLAFAIGASQLALGSWRISCKNSTRPLLANPHDIAVPTGMCHPDWHPPFRLTLPFRLTFARTLAVPQDIAVPADIAARAAIRHSDCHSLFRLMLPFRPTSAIPQDIRHPNRHLPSRRIFRVPPQAARNFLSPARKRRVPAIDMTLSPFRGGTNRESKPAFRNLMYLRAWLCDA
jgi:hypothetical protein